MSFIGVSSSCFYPKETEKAFLELAQNNIKVSEVFINAKSEFKPPFINTLNEIKNEYDIRILSVHPYSSFAENFMLFSSYKRRFNDFINDVKEHFEAAAKLSAKYYVVHGIRLPGSISDEEYFERFMSMIELGRQYDILPIQENVVRHRSESPEFLLKMRKYVGKDFKMVLDIKQAKRAGFSAFDFVSCLSGSIAHVHISDHTDESDCILPLTGNFDFARLFNEMKNLNYKGDYIVELYSNSFKGIDEIKLSIDRLKGLL